MNSSFLKKTHLTAVTVLAIVFMSNVLPASAASITGTWHGSGVATLKSGGKEKVRCKVTYGRIAGQNFSLSAKCASGAGRLSQVGRLTRIKNGKYVGNVHNAEYNVRATVAVTVRNGKQSVLIRSDKGSARLQLTRR